jgi:hypothetical protein
MRETTIGLCFFHVYNSQYIKFTLKQLAIVGSAWTNERKIQRLNILVQLAFTTQHRTNNTSYLFDPPNSRSRHLIAHSKCPAHLSRCRNVHLHAWYVSLHFHPRFQRVNRPILHQVADTVG